MNEQDYQKVEQEMLAADESHLWPICGRFNVTEYAIDLIAGSGLECDTPDGYRAAIVAVISDYVNNEENW